MSGVQLTLFDVVAIVIVLRRSPGKIIAEIPVELPDMRDQIATKELDAFVRLRGEVARLVRAAARGDEALLHEQNGRP